MNHKESFTIGFKELLSNKLKTILTMLGIIFGVASVIAMLSIGEGARQESLEQIQLLGTNNIIIKQSSVGVENGKQVKSFSAGLSLKDMLSIKKLIPGIDTVTPQKEAVFNVSYKAKTGNVKIIATTANYPYTYNSKISMGKFFSKHHNDEYATVCVIGSGIKSKFFKFENPVNKSIKIGENWFHIIGVVGKKNISKGSEQLGVRNFNNEIYIPLQTLTCKMDLGEESQAVTGFRIVFVGSTGKQDANIAEKDKINLLTVKVTDDKKIGQTATLIERILNRKHYGTKDYEIIVPEEIIEQKQKTQNIFNIVMGAIAGISLLVGGIGIMNIMLANIMERTKEIGIRMAIGATKKDVLYQFLYEAIIISVIGGLIGVFLGFVLTSLITTYAEWKTIITPTSVILAFTVAVATGIGFGSYPAKKAAEKNPIESLRYE